MSGILKYFSKPKKRKSSSVPSIDDAHFVDDAVPSSSLTSPNLQDDLTQSAESNSINSPRSVSPCSTENQLIDHDHDLLSIASDSDQEMPTSDRIEVLAEPPAPKSESFFDNKKTPCQPKLQSYPSTTFGKKQRRFNSSWFKTFEWLEYNQEMDAAFCFACRVFPAKGKHYEAAFIKTGYPGLEKSNGTQQRIA